MNISSIISCLSANMYASLLKTCVLRFAWLVSLLFMSVSRTMLFICCALPACLTALPIFNFIYFYVSYLDCWRMWYSRKECLCRKNWSDWIFLFVCSICIKHFTSYSSINLLFYLLTKRRNKYPRLTTKDNVFVTC